MNPLNLVSAGINLASNFLSKREDRKLAKVTINGKLREAKQKNEQEVVLNRQEWESIGQIKQDSTWKDELVTVVILWPYVQMFLGGMETAFLGTTNMSDALNISLKALESLGVDIGYLMGAVVLAAIGIRYTKS